MNSENHFASAQSGKEGPEGSAGPGAEAGRVPRVLIVEDELFVAWHLESLVRELQLDVCGLVPDGEGAIEQAADFEPNLILMDISLSGEIDGVEAARRIRDRKHVPIIFITAYSDAATVARVEKAVPGAQVLAKPVSTARLRAAIEGALPALKRQQ
jgi:CheY-like chemotaxis protein